MEASYHTSVMLKEAVDSLNCRAGHVYLDGTLGGGGHAYEILKRTVPDGILIGIDTDEDAINEAGQTLREFGDRAILVKDNFIRLKRVLTNLHIEKVDGILLDLGVSSHQLQTEARGFSFSVDAPLDMRMSRDSDITAHTLVNTLEERELEKILREFGEEPAARRIARAIVKRRHDAPINTTSELAQLIAGVLHRGRKKGRIHPATKTFQALRIAVNHELDNLRTAIMDGIDVLNADGRFSVISFHSLEDRIVKTMFRSWERECVCPPDFPICVCNREKKLKVLTKKAIMPGEDEVRGNPRARSARLRTAIRV